MNILWLLEKELDVSLSSAGRLATIQNLEKRNTLKVVVGYRHRKNSYDYLKSRIIYVNSTRLAVLKKIGFFYNQLYMLRSLNLLSNIDVVLINCMNKLLINAIVKKKKRYNYKVVFDVRTLAVDENSLRRRINESLFRNSLKYAAKYCDGVTYITEEMRRYCKERYNLPEHESEVWGSGVDPTLFKNVKNHNIRRRDRNLKLIYHGTVEKNRGIDNVVKAIQLLKNTIPIKFGVMGSGHGLKELRRLVHKFDLNGRVEFMEPVPHHRVPEVIMKFDAGILPVQDFPGWNASSPIKLFEYLSCGKPVIVTRIPAHSQVLSKKRFAFWAEESSAQAIAWAIEYAYENMENFLSMGIKARQFIEDHYTWESQIKRLENFLINLN